MSRGFGMFLCFLAAYLIGVLVGYLHGFDDGSDVGICATAELIVPEIPTAEFEPCVRAKTSSRVAALAWVRGSLQ